MASGVSPLPLRLPRAVMLIFSALSITGKVAIYRSYFISRRLPVIRALVESRRHAQPRAPGPSASACALMSLMQERYFEADGADSIIYIDAGLDGHTVVSTDSLLDIHFDASLKNA